MPSCYILAPYSPPSEALPAPALCFPNTLKFWSLLNFLISVHTSLLAFLFILQDPFWPPLGSLPEPPGQSQAFLSHCKIAPYAPIVCSRCVPNQSGSWGRKREALGEAVCALHCRPE